MADKPPGDEYPALDLTVLTLQPGDIILLRSPHRVSQFMCETLTARCKKEFPGHKVLVLEDGLELSILRPADTQAETAPPCPTCHGTGTVPDWKHWTSQPGGPPNRPCPDCATPDDQVPSPQG